MLVNTFNFTNVNNNISIKIQLHKYLNILFGETLSGKTHILKTFSNLGDGFNVYDSSVNLYLNKDMCYDDFIDTTFKEHIDALDALVNSDYVDNGLIDCLINVIKDINVNYLPEWLHVDYPFKNNIEKYFSTSIKRLFIIIFDMLFLYGDNDCIYTIDDIEFGFSEKWLSNIIPTLHSINPKCQLVITTKSSILRNTYKPNTINLDAL